MAAALLSGGVGLCQETVQPTEYQVKAAFLYHFAKFTEWPPAVFTNPTMPLVIGVLGASPFGGDLERTLSNKRLEARPLLPMQVSSALHASTNCHILFISSSERRKLPEILTDLRGASVLTVSEMDEFTESGGMIKFVWRGTKIRFQINDEAAKQARLKIRSKLLSLAVGPAG
jgi:hypothetical protein